MIDVTEINLDKYLNWYEKLSIEILNSKGLETRTKERQNSKEQTDSLHLPFAWGLGGKMEEYSKWEEMQKHFKEQNKPEELQLYLACEYYIPTKNDWERLKYIRQKATKEKDAELIEEFGRSALPENEFITQKLELVHKEVFDVFSYFENIRVGTPLLKTILEENSGGLTKDIWPLFCQWVSDFDFLKSLHRKSLTTNKNSTTPQSAIQTVNGIALYYWYLRQFNGPDLTNAKVLHEASEIFKVSKKKLQLAFNKIGTGKDLITIDKNTNFRKAKLNMHQFAYLTLRERSTNSAAIEASFKTLKEVERKINNPNNH